MRLRPEQPERVWSYPSGYEIIRESLDCLIEVHGEELPEDVPDSEAVFLLSPSSKWVILNENGYPRQEPLPGGATLVY